MGSKCSCDDIPNGSCASTAASATSGGAGRIRGDGRANNSKQPSSYFPSSDFLIHEANDIFFRYHFPQRCDISRSYFESDIAAHHSMTAQPKNKISGASSSLGESRDKTFKDSVLVELVDKGLKKRATTYKGNRHNKVKTTRGLRNRRIRLSIDIVRQFFDLLEILGFDKGSKTLEWLFNKSEAEIKKLR